MQVSPHEAKEGKLIDRRVGVTTSDDTTCTPVKRCPMRRVRGQIRPHLHPTTQIACQADKCRGQCRPHIRARQGAANRKGATYRESEEERQGQVESTRCTNS